jgi:hypothetical protein
MVFFAGHGMRYADKDYLMLADSESAIAPLTRKN